MAPNRAHDLYSHQHFWMKQKRIQFLCWWLDGETKSSEEIKLYCWNYKQVVELTIYMFKTIWAKLQYTQMYNYMNSLTKISCLLFPPLFLLHDLQMTLKFTWFIPTNLIFWSWFTATSSFWSKGSWSSFWWWLLSTIYHKCMNL